MKKILIATICLLTALSGQASTGIDQVLASIAQNNLQLQALQSEQQAEMLDARSENALSGPTVEYSPFYKDGASGMAESELVISQEFQFPTRYVARNKQNQLHQQALQNRYLAARRSLLLEAELICFEIIHKNQSLLMLQQRLSGSESLLKLFQKRMETGDANILELNKVKLDYMEVLTSLNETENERHRLLCQLQELNGGQALELADTLYPEQNLLLDMNKDLAAGVARDYEVLAAQQELSVQKQSVTLSKQEWLPNLTVGFRQNKEGNEAVNGFLVGASFPILGNHKSKAAQHRKLSAELQLQETQLSVENDIRTNYMELEGLRRVMADYDVAMMHQMLTLLNKALQHGQISALQYYTEIDGIYAKLEAHLTLTCQAAKLQSKLKKRLETNQ